MQLYWYVKMCDANDGVDYWLMKSGGYYVVPVVDDSLCLKLTMNFVLLSVIDLLPLLLLSPVCRTTAVDGSVDCEIVYCNEVIH